jgi:hypothetical protein
MSPQKTIKGASTNLTPQQTNQNRIGRLLRDRSARTIKIDKGIVLQTALLNLGHKTLEIELQLAPATTAVLQHSNKTTTTIQGPTTVNHLYAQDPPISTRIFVHVKVHNKVHNRTKTTVKTMARSIETTISTQQSKFSSKYPSKQQSK